MERTCVLLTLVLACLAFSLASAQGGKRKKIVCYYGSWATYRKGDGKFDVEHINPMLCTDLVYAFAGLDNVTNSIISLDTNHDITLGGYRRAVNLKSQNPNLKVYISIGGWNEGSAKFSKMASTFQTRAAFIQSVVDFLQMHKFDGLDIDWEYPTARGGAPEDKENFAMLLKELKSELRKRNWLLTVAISALESKIDSCYDLKALEQYCDFVYVMCYDYHGSWDGVTGHNAPLFAKKDDTWDNKLLTVDHTISYILKQGFPASKLLLGVPLYGRTFVLENPSENEVYSPAQSAGFSGPLTLENGFLGYLEICQLQQDPQWTMVYDSESHVPFMYKGPHWVSYDDHKSLQEKTLYALRNQLAGLKVWSLEVDDLNGKCTKTSLMSTINNVMDEFYTSDNNEISQNNDDRSSSSCAVLSLVVTLISVVSGVLLR